MSSNINITLHNPWESHIKNRPGIVGKGMHNLAITLLVLSLIVLVGEIIFFSLSLTQMLPYQQMIAKMWDVYSIQNITITALSASLIVISSILIHQKNRADWLREKKAYQQWSETVGGFRVEDPPPIPGFAWPTNLPRVLIISSEEGGGHRKAAAAIEAALQGKYCVKTVYPLGALSSAKWFNWCQQKNWKTFKKFLVKAQWYAERFGVFANVHTQMRKEILLFRPQVIFSVQPVSNVFLERIAHKFHTPLVVVPTDYKTDHFFYLMQNPSTNLHVCLPLDDEYEKAVLKEKYGIQSDQITITGYPIRPGFQDEQKQAVLQEIVRLKEEYQWAERDKALTISMGLQGGPDLLKYSRMLGKAESMKISEGTKLHAFAICGTNTKLKSSVEKIKSKNPNIILHPIGLVESDITMAAYLHLSRIFQTKPGGGATSEGLACGAYMFFNNSEAQVTEWEPVNMGKAIEFDQGEAIKDSTLIRRMETILEIPKPEPIDFPGRQFGQNILNLVDQITPH